MLTRHQQIDRFLQRCQLGTYDRKPLAADASFRRYERVITLDKTYILMDAPPDKEPVQPFVQMTELLRASGLHAPQILYQDKEAGLLLSEDLGTASYSQHLRAHPQDEWPLYRAALDVLLQLREEVPGPPEWLKPYAESEYMREIRLFSEWFLPAAGKEQLATEYQAIWQDVLRATALQSHVVVLRDYHADNLMWLPTLEGVARVGLLDYQDALHGDAAYDLVSLLEDARRDVAPETQAQALEYYLQRSGEDEAAFRARYAMLGAQRNCKIIGIFHRLAARDGKPHYLDYLPRVWGHLARDVSHPALAQLAEWFERHALFALADQRAFA